MNILKKITIYIFLLSLTYNLIAQDNSNVSEAYDIAIKAMDNMTIVKCLLIESVIDFIFLDMFF